MFRVRHNRVLLALCALLGALLYAGWVPHHALMRISATAGSLSAEDAAIAAATQYICSAHQQAAGSSDPTQMPGHTTLAQMCPICALHAVAAHKAPDEPLQVAWPALQPVRLTVVAEVLIQPAALDHPTARGPPARV